MPNTEDDLAEFGDFDVSAAQEQRAAIEEFSFSNSKMLGKFTEGATTLRVLPQRRDSKQTTPFLTVFEHFVQTAGGPVSFYCPRMHARRPCPVCQESAQKMASKNMAVQEQGKKLRPSQKFLANVVVRGREDTLGVKVWKGSGKMQESMLKYLTEMGVQFANPVHGQDITVMRTGQGLQTEYELSLNHKGPSRLARTPDAMRALLDQMHDLESVVTLLSPDEINAKLAGRAAAPGTGRGGNAGGNSWGGSSGTAQGRSGAFSSGGPRRPAAAPPPPAEEALGGFDDLDSDTAGQGGQGEDDFPEGY